jgi:hypothetical protein
MQLRSGTTLHAPAAPAPAPNCEIKCNEHRDKLIREIIREPTVLLLNKIEQSPAGPDRLKLIIELWKYLLSIEVQLRQLLTPTNRLFDVILRKTVSVLEGLISLSQEGQFQTAEEKQIIAEFITLNQKVILMINNIKGSSPYPNLYRIYLSLPPH